MIGSPKKKNKGGPRKPSRLKKAFDYSLTGTAVTSTPFSYRVFNKFGSGIRFTKPLKPSVLINEADFPPSKMLTLSI